jgi:hypothetical protein
MQPSGLVEQLFDIHGDGHALGDTAGQRAGFRGFGDPGGLGQFGADPANVLIAGSIVLRSMMPSVLTGTVTLRWP